MSSFRTPTAFDSPTEVPQCSTSTDSAACTADTPHIRPAAHKAPMIARNFIVYLLQTPEQKTDAPGWTGCGGWSNRQTGRSNVGQPMRVHGRARRYPAAGRSRDEWFGMQLT